METKKKKRLKLYILLAAIWFVVTLPLPWIVNNPDIPQQQFANIMTIIVIMSVPFIVLAIVWSLKPELTT